MHRGSEDEGVAAPGPTLALEGASTAYLPTKGPLVTVVIPTRDREARLSFALEGLATQTIGCDRFEVLVVRDPDAPGPFAEAPPSLQCRFLTLEQRAGPGVKRDLGWREGTAPLVVFTDDDCRPEPGWLEALLAAWGGREACVLQGRTEIDPDEAHLLFGLARTTEVSSATPWFETCNIAYPRSLLELLDGFDDSFDFGGEDTDLGIRAVRAGAPQEFVEPALCYHAVVAPVFWRAIRSADRLGSLPLLLKTYPQMRRHLILGVFRNAAHANLTLAALGVVALPLTGPWSLLLTVPYLARATVLGARRSPRQVARLVVQLPARLARDVVEVVGTVRGALRHRTLMI